MRLDKTRWTALREKGELDATVARALRIDGVVLLESVYEAETVAELRAAFDAELALQMPRMEANRGAKRYGINLPMAGVWAREDVAFSPLVKGALRELLGDKLACTYLAADTPLPGSEFQKAHADGFPLFPELPVALPGYAYVVDVPLVDFREDNGPLEMWGGATHLVAGQNPAEAAQDVPSEFVLCPAGSIIVRDTRGWHRGTPNRSHDLRPMLALVYQRDWYRFEAETGSPVVPIAAEAWASWSNELRHVFRFNAVGAGD
jgi:hypothetical protein